MKVTKELLEKYHRGECSPEETKVVDQWLLEDEAEVPVLDTSESLKLAMWDSIQSSIAPRKIHPIRRYAPWAAACVLILTAIGIWFRPTPPANDYVLAAGPDSQVQVASSGTIELCGSVQIQPRKDMQLSVTGLKRETTPERINCKKGETYFAFYSCQFPSNEIIVIKEKSLNELQPVAKRQLMDQLGI